MVKSLHIRVSSNSVKAHTRWKKTYECSQYSKRFLGNTMLKIHIRTHTGEKTQNFHQRGKVFSVCNNVKKHKKNTYWKESL